MSKSCVAAQSDWLMHPDVSHGLHNAEVTQNPKAFSPYALCGQLHLAESTILPYWFPGAWPGCIRGLGILSDSLPDLLLPMKQFPLFFFPQTYVNLLCFVTELERIQNGRGAGPSHSPWPVKTIGPAGIRESFTRSQAWRARPRHTGREGPRGCRATPECYDWARKAFSHPDGSNKGALWAQRPPWRRNTLSPAEPTSDMNCAVYVLESGCSARRFYHHLKKGGTL